MSNVRFIADTHFGHEKLIRNLRNMEPEEHDQLIIDNWNRVVTKKDITYVLGDFVFEKPDFIEKYLLQLNGEIRIIGGNHDDRRCCQKFRELGVTVLGCLEYKGFICTHIPVHPTELSRFESLGQGWAANIHGHTHEELVGDHYYLNVCCEHVGYTPRTLNEILEIYWKK